MRARLDTAMNSEWKQPKEDFKIKVKSAGS